MDFLNVYKGKKVLVTGHTGFKGSWLCLWLKSLGVEVIGIGLDARTSRDNFVLANISKIVKDFREDICNRNHIIQLIQAEKPEIIFHMAAQPLVLESYKNPLKTFETNIMGTTNLLEAIRLTDSVKTAIFITTDKVYDNKEWVWPYREDEPLGGYDPYSSSKGASELVIASYRKSFFNPFEYNKHNKSIASARAGNVIGGGDWGENRIIPDCIRAIEDGLPIEIRSPDSIRPWQHVLEPLGAYLLLGAKMINDPVTFAEAWNFGPEPANITSVKSLVEILIDKYGKGSLKDISNPEIKHEAKLLALDINKSKHRLSWSPILDIDETITMTIEWYKNYKSEDMMIFCQKQIQEYVKLWKLRNVN
jgi:CDP-glucose 4,6-dehydratase